MPRKVNHDDRRREIVRATLEVLAESGPKGVTVRSVSAKIGGSTTLVTHYFNSRQALFDSLAEVAVDWWGEELAAIENGISDPQERLRALLEWLLPLDATGILEERARISLLAEKETRDRSQRLLDTWDARIRSLLGEHLRALVPQDRLDLTVDVLRNTTNGICLSVVEHEDQWPTSRQLAVLNEVLNLLGLKLVK